MLRTEFIKAPAAAAAAVEWHTSNQPVGYQAAVTAMEERAAAIAGGAAAELVWLLEHPPLYTAGTSAQTDGLREPRFPLHASGRGGQLTYHGPGQRVAYVMLDLNARGRDVRRFVAAVEEWIIRAIARFDIVGERRQGRVGVWVRRPDKGPDCEDKIAAIGIRIRRWVTLHGVALNVDCDLTHYSGIVPCGIFESRYGVTSLADLGRRQAVVSVDGALRDEFEQLFGRTVATKTVDAVAQVTPSR
jgi:lipoyl(octanoyl) transferase